MTKFACAATLAVLVALAVTWGASAQTALTPAQYQSAMSNWMIAQGDYGKLANPHKALAACIIWSQSQGDTVTVGPSATMGGDDLAMVKDEAMKMCVDFEKDNGCTCQIVDVDGAQAQ